MKEERYRETEPLKKGELVVMHTCVEARNPKYEGKIWTCKTDQFTQGEGAYAQDLIFLEGFTGSFASEFLQRVNVEPLLAEKDATIASYEHNRKLYQEESAELRKQKDAINRALVDGPQPGMTADEYRTWLYAVLPFLDDGLEEGENR